MSRDANGNYTLPTGNPVITGNTIDSSWANDTMSDLGNEITNSLDRFGKGGMAAPLRLINGSMTIPSMSFTNETNSGFYRAGVGDIRLSIRNKDAVRVLENAKLELLQGVYTFNGNGLFQTTNKLYVGADETAPEVFTTDNISAYAQTLLDDANATAARNTLGLGTAAVKNVNDMGDIIIDQLAITGNDFESVGARGIHMGNTPSGSVLYSINFNTGVYQDFSIFTKTLTLGSGGFSRAVLDENGNLGLGNFAPEAKLHVNGDIIADGVFLGGKVAANKLDDYEEGTFPITNLTIGGSTVTNLTGSLKYTKIGRQVFVGIRVFYTSGNAVNIDGVLQIALPFVVANNSGGINSAVINAGGLNYPSGYMLYAFQNEAKATLYINNNLNSASNLAANTGDFVFVSNINYETN